MGVARESGGAGLRVSRGPGEFQKKCRDRIVQLVLTRVDSFVLSHLSPLEDNTALKNGWYLSMFKPHGQLFTHLLY